MKDPFGREISYLRISVTDRCNLRCRYCMPPEGVKPLAHEDILRFEQIVEVAAEAVRFGFRKFRLTGGEPLVRRGVEDLVAMLAGLAGVEDLAMTTNGTLLADRAEALKAAGLGRVNVSLDAIVPERYRMITRGGNVADAIAGIESAIAAGLTPVKINCVVPAADPIHDADNALDAVAAGPAEAAPASGTGDADGQPPLSPDARDVAAFAESLGCAVRLIPQMDLPSGQFATVYGGAGGRCGECDRLRLTSDGFVRPCLMSNLRYDVRKLGPTQAIRLAVAAKPEAGEACDDRAMNGIGG